MQSKCLIADIETFPLLTHVWGLKDQNIGLNQIVKDTSIAAWGAKWLGDSPKQFMYESTQFNKDVRYDKNILPTIWKLLDEADILITQNGKSFDSRRLNARFIACGMKPPSPYRHIDTYLLIKSVADFTSNKLEYLTNKLCNKYKKLSHSNFPGMSLWNECLKGNKEAWKEMFIYNRHDVLSTEELYEAVKAWNPQNATRVFTDPNKCRMCGQFTENRGFTPNGLKRKIHCLNRMCGAWGTAPLVKDK